MQCLRAHHTLESHTAKALQAARDITQLVRLPSPLQNHASVLSCCVVLASIVHLSFWSFVVPDGEDASVKEVIRFDIGVLKSLGKLWPIAAAALGQVRGVAQEMLTSKRAMRIHSWNPMTSNEIIESMIEDADSADLLAGTAPLEYSLIPDLSSTSSPIFWCGKE